MNRVGYRRRHRDDWSLTDAHAVVRSAAHRSLDDDLTQPRDIANAGDLIIAEVERRHFAVGKEQFFGQCVACPMTMLPSIWPSCKSGLSTLPV